MKNMKKIILLAACLFAAFATADASEGAVKKIWPEGKMPGTACKEKETFKIFRNKDKRINFVSTPTLEFFMAGGGNPSGLIIVCPGGAYRDIWYVNEGVEIAERLSKAGISCAVLKYRIPDNTKGALMDIQRAIRFARANAKELNINPDKIGVMGFSAGANLSARASATDKSAYENVDGIDEISCKPDCTVLVYPAYCDQPTYDWRWNGKEKPQDMDYSAQKLENRFKHASCVYSANPGRQDLYRRFNRILSCIKKSGGAGGSVFIFKRRAWLLPQQPKRQGQSLDKSVRRLAEGNGVCRR